MPTIYDELRASHEAQRHLCRSMSNARSSPRHRKEAFAELAVELEAHAAAEERYLYVPMLMLDGGLSVSRHALSEHHEIEEMVDETRGVDPESTDFRSGTAELAHLVRHHLDEEEHGFFQLSGRLLTAAQKVDLRVSYLADYERMKRPNTVPT